MQVAAKLFLNNEDDFYRLSSNQSLLLEEELIYTDHYFDSPSYILHRDHDTLRLRIQEMQSTTGPMGKVNLPSLTLKDHNRIESGDQAAFVYTIKDVNEVVVKELLNSKDILTVLKKHYSFFLNDPTSHVSTIIGRLQSVEDMTDDVSEKIKFVESTRTHRRVYKYVNRDSFGVEDQHTDLFYKVNHSFLSDVKIYLDETNFPFGKMYEVEAIVLSAPLNDVRMDLEEFLNSLSINYSWSLESKCSNLMKYLKGLDTHSTVVSVPKMSIGSFDGYVEVLNWLTNHCHFVSIIPNSMISSQAAGGGGGGGGEFGLHDEDSTNENYYFHATGREASFFATQDTINMFTQSQQHWSQRVGGGGNLEHKSLESFHTEDDRQEYQENYYFDDALNGTLQMNFCIAELRCINQGASFIFSLKKNQYIVNGSQHSTTYQSEISGDVARHLLRDPMDFLNTMREFNNVAAVLWDEYCLRELHVVAFYRTKRYIFSRPITTIFPSWAKLEKQRHQIGDDDDSDLTRLGTKELLLSSAINNGQLPSININLDYTLFNCTTPATHFSVIAAQSPSCSYATVSEFNLTPNCVGLYEIEVTGINENFQEAVKNWLIYKLRKRGVELQKADRTKLQKYMDLIPELQR